MEDNSFLRKVDQGTKVINAINSFLIPVVLIGFAGTILFSKAQQIGIVEGKNILPIEPDSKISEPGMNTNIIPSTSYYPENNQSEDKYSAATNLINRMFGGQNNSPDTQQTDTQQTNTEQSDTQLNAHPKNIQGICGQVSRDLINWRHRFEVQTPNGIVEATFAGNPNSFTIIPQWGKRFGCEDASSIIRQVK